MKPTLMFYCQHVLGMGHLVRSRELIKGLGDFDVTFVNGGEPVEGFALPAGVRLVQLPPIASDAEFRDIDATEEIRNERRRRLLDLFRGLAPDVLVIEMFPFGRRKFGFELLPLLEENERRGHGTVVASSVRDILVSKRDQARHEDNACRVLNEHFDLVLVHSDPRFQQLSETFGRAADIRCPVAYTGFVAEPAPIPLVSRRPSGSAHVVASVGGGRVGFELLDAVIKASRMLALEFSHKLSVYAGPYHPDQQYALLQAQAADAPWITLSRYTADFVEQLTRADLLVSMAGYNTCMNILATGIPALVHPFTGNQNDEQTIRARKLEGLGLLGVLDDASLDSTRLAGLMRSRLEDSTRPAAPRLDLHGVRNTARTLAHVLETRRVHV